MKSNSARHYWWVIFIKVLTSWHRIKAMFMCSGESKVKSQMFKVEGKLSCDFEQLTFDFRLPIQVFSKIESRFLIF